MKTTLSLEEFEELLRKTAAKLHDDYQIEVLSIVSIMTTVYMLDNVFKGIDKKTSEKISETKDYLMTLYADVLEDAYSSYIGKEIVKEVEND